jgi:AcrR family transcriptional regulator
VPRPRIHQPDTVLDHARDIVLERGVRAATMEAIARTSGAPMGSLYHYFSSHDELLARLWVRAVRRSQAAFRAAAEHEDPEQAALAAALSIYDFCVRERDDARLLMSMRREDLMQAELSGDLARELKELNRPVRQTLEQLSRRLYGRAESEDIDRVLLATFDLPYGIARPYALRGRPAPKHRRKLLGVAIVAVISDGGRTPREI